jgi:hypothetical protein
MLDFDTVIDIGLTLPLVVEGTAYRGRALKLRGKILACVPANKSAEVNCAVVRIAFERRAELLQESPETYYLTDHYTPYPTVLVRLSKITRGDLKKLLREAWEFVSREASEPATRKGVARATTRRKPTSGPGKRRTHKIE